MKFSIETIPSHQVAFIRNVGPYGKGNSAAMDQLKAWAKSNDLLNENSILYGIAHDDPMQTRPQNCRYDTCIAVKDNFKRVGAIQFARLAGGKYAILTTAHTAAAIQRAWQDVFLLLAKQHYQLDATRPVLERYKTKVINNRQCELCVPIQ